MLIQIYVNQQHEYCRWTNITEALSSQFVEGDDASVNMDFSPACLGPRYREPFFVKYPWILEDIIVRPYCLMSNTIWDLQVLFFFLWRKGLQSTDSS